MKRTASQQAVFFWENHPVLDAAGQEILDGITVMITYLSKQAAEMGGQLSE